LVLPIIEAVSDAVGAPSGTLFPLSEAIDFDGLDTIVSSEPSHDVTITFRYAGRRVLVYSNETIYVRPLQEPCRNEPPTAADR
jgi:hypothetical protein